MKFTAKITFVFVLIIVYRTVCAQEVHIKIVQQGKTFKDSSYYDIVPVGNQFWIGGKYGTLKSSDSLGHLSNIEYPNQNVDIYKIDRFDAQNLIACADKGIVYKHNLVAKTWEVIKVKGYEKACFYNMAVVNDSTAFIGGGNTAIAHSQKTIPLGFILKTIDRGRTWQKVYSNAFKMVWCVKYNPHDRKVYALMYSPNRTHLYALENDRWQRRQKVGNSIFHEIQFENATDFIATGGWIGKKGRIYRNTHKQVINDAGLIWGRVSNHQYDLYTACNGQIILDTKKGNYKRFGVKLNDQFSIYEAIFTSANTALAIGSAQTLLHITVQESALTANHAR
ncbi:WD40/YVTN/BNR-like repeat-containing protein [Runella sp.]|uniref:WD40/YVTN/BNR-like repeat-containing protein n=1 Tax=Runella sp. TaxID=1960881 RepID=UPI003D0B2D9E